MYVNKQLGMSTWTFDGRYRNKERVNHIRYRFAKKGCLFFNNSKDYRTWKIYRATSWKRLRNVTTHWYKLTQIKHSRWIQHSYKIISIYLFYFISKFNYYFYYFFFNKKNCHIWIASSVEKRNEGKKRKNRWVAVVPMVPTGHDRWTLVDIRTVYQLAFQQVFTLESKITQSAKHIDFW